MGAEPRIVRASDQCRGSGSPLASRAPVGDAVGVALAARADRRPAPRAGPVRLPVDASRAAAGLEASLHHRPALGDETLGGGRAELVDRAPRAHPRSEAGLVADRV